MSDLRFQKASLYEQQGEISSFRGLDPLTGLPVLIYTFPQKPLLSLNDLQSENIPGLLSNSYEDEGVLVTAHSSEYQPLKALEPENAIQIILGSARALKDAAQAGVIHGDIRPKRFLVADNHVLVEGFGVPWTAEGSTYSPPEYRAGGSFEGDIYSWAKSLKQLSSLRLPGELSALLEACLAPEPHLRPVAKDVYDSLVAIAERLSPASFSGPLPEAEKGKTAVVEEDKNSFDSLELDFDFDAALSERPFGDPAEPSNDASAYGPDSSYIDSSDEAPFVMDSDPGLYHSEADAAVTLDDTEPDRLVSSPPKQAAPAGNFVKDLPPGATYKRGSESELRVPSSIPEAIDLGEEKSSPNYRNVARLFAVLFIAALAAVLLLLYQRLNQVPTEIQADQERTRYRVAINVEPADVPPVEVIVVESPPGSEYRPGNILGRRTTVILDQSGTWQLQGRFQEQVSAPVSFAVPGVDEVTLVIPEALPPSD